LYPEQDVQVYHWAKFKFQKQTIHMPLSDIEKSAILLIALGPERAQRILDQLSTAELMPLIEAMKRMKSIAPEVRDAVLEEVASLLEDLSKGKQPTTPEAMDLLKSIGPYIPEAIDPDKIDWNRAGFDFDPPDDENPQLPGGRR
jgi:Mg/Co/Ni transporter MgtE